MIPGPDRFLECLKYIQVELNEDTYQKYKMMLEIIAWNIEVLAKDEDFKERKHG